MEYKHARDFRDLVAYKAFSSDYIAVPLLDRESPCVSHCARARSYHGKRAILDLERTRGEKLAYMDTYRWIFRFFTPLTFSHEAARIESRCRKFDSRQIGRQNSTPLRSPFPLLSLALVFLSQPRRESNGIYVLVVFTMAFDPLDPPSGVDRRTPPSAKVIGSPVHRLPFSPLTVCSLRRALVSFSILSLTLSLPIVATAAG